jgi:putative phosphoribosyl transferase
LPVSIIFRDRTEAGRLLGDALRSLREEDVIVLAIPRGGVPVAKEAASAIGVPLDLIVTHKIGAPGNPELAVGAVTQEGEVITNPGLVKRLRITDDYLRSESLRQLGEIKSRMKKYRGDRPYPRLDGRTVVIVDDGVATGSTIQAAVLSVKRMNAARIVLAVPVAPPETVSELSKVADQVICLSTPERFSAVGQFYRELEQVEDEEVREILDSALTGQQGR